MLSSPPPDPLILEAQETPLPERRNRLKLLPAISLHRDRWEPAVILFLVAAITFSLYLLFSQWFSESPARGYLRVSLKAVEIADYSVDERPIVVPAINLDILESILEEDALVEEDTRQRLEALEGSLEAPVPTPTPGISPAATQGAIYVITPTPTRTGHGGEVKPTEGLRETVGVTSTATGVSSPTPTRIAYASPTATLLKTPSRTAKPTTGILTATPQASATPAQTATPLPLPTRSPVVTPVPSSTPVPTATDKPTNTPVPTATSQPTSAPTSTSRPIDPPAPTATDKPTNTPVPTETPQPTSRPTPTPVAPPTSPP